MQLTTLGMPVIEAAERVEALALLETWNDMAVLLSDTVIPSLRRPRAGAACSRPAPDLANPARHQVLHCISINLLNLSNGCVHWYDYVLLRPGEELKSKASTYSATVSKSSEIAWVPAVSGFTASISLFSRRSSGA